MVPNGTKGIFMWKCEWGKVGLEKKMETSSSENREFICCITSP